MDLVLGVWASAFWESYRTTWFMNPARAAGHEPQLLGLVIGLILIFFAAMQIDTIRGIRQEREGVYRFPIFFGGYLLVSSIATFLVMQGWSPKIMTMGGFEFLLVDGLRGGCLVAFGILAMRAPATVTELRLPKQAMVGSDRAEESSRDREPWRRRGRESGRNRSGRSGSKRGGGRRTAAEASNATQQRQGQSPRQQRQSGGAESARSGSSEAAKDRSLSVVVKGDFRSGSDRGASSGESGGNESGRDGRRRRRRRGDSASTRSERGSDSNESTNGAGSERANARAGTRPASLASESFSPNGNGTEGAVLETRAGGVESASRSRGARRS
jgi:hypothetical protein